jgi:hypothetical protein
MGGADVKCDACDGDLEHDVVELEVRIAGRVASISQPGWYCWTCQNARFSAADLESTERQLSASRHDGATPQANPPVAKAA